MRRFVLLFAALLASYPGAAHPAWAESVLIRAVGAEVTSLDPHLIGNQYETVVAADLFEGLTAYGPDGSIRPGAAASWDVSADGKTYLFHLRPGLVWSDGSALTAEDFVYAFRRGLTPKTGAPYNEILYPILGAEAWATGKTTDPAALGVDAPDPATVRIRLERPAQFLPAILAYSMAFPVPRAAIERWGADWTRPGHLVGNGPFTLVEAVPQARLVFARNPHFHDAASVKLDQVRWVVMADEAAFKAFRTGEIDLATVPARLLPEARRDLAASLREQRLLIAHYVDINMTRAPLGQDPKLRRALALALDQVAVETKVVKDGGVGGFSIVPDGMPGYRPAREDFADRPMADRLAEARRLWAEAGYGPDHPLALRLMTDDVANYLLEGKAIATLWQAALPGLKVSLDVNEYQVVTGRLVDHDYDVALSSWSADFPDPWNFLAAWRTGAGNANVVGYRNAAYDRLLDEAAALLEPASRLARLAAAERVLLDDCAILPYGFESESSLVAARVTGWQPNELGIHLSRYLGVTGTP
ncbi:ABC transporter substrate-binding protein [Aliidongia dinghuensis]|uniref:ABC transporter substrate-binding protein n=1 Tax=Aliidongia dinghuensis TaxID=1867774 RepID=A0A8J2YQ68_9PROT|nr:peptide ABC transporter substrate-binding protein [Aliidongia dinghuensis]GGF05678.1 ABC transporter substrate-binding protein [Aliidongia dinghuensis]